MARKEISTSWDRNNRNAINENFNELYLNSERRQKELDQAILEGDSSPLGGQLSVGADATVYSGPQDRLVKENEKVTSLLAERATYEDVNKYLAKISDGTPEFANNESEMTDVSRIYVNLTDGLLYAHDGDVWASTGVKYQSTGLADESVSTNHLKDTITTRNLFKGEYVDGLLFGGGTTGTTPMYTRNNYDIYKGKTAVIPIFNNKSYTIKIHEPTKQTHFRVGFTENYPIFSDTNNQPIEVVRVNENDLISEYTFTNTKGDGYLSIYVSNIGQEPKMQVEVGVKATDYIPNRLIKSDHIQDFYEEKNEPLFDSLYVNGILFHYGPHNKLYSVRNFDNYKGKIAVFSVLPNTEYTITINEPNKSNVVRIGTHRERLFFGEYDGTEASLEGIPPFDRMIYTSNPGNAIPNEFTFKSSDTDRFLYIYTSNEGKEPVVLLDRKVNAKTYEGESYRFYEDLIGTYPYFEAMGVEASSDMDFMSMHSDDLYGLYDQLMSRHPYNVSKRLYGYGTAIDGSEDTNLPIYEYAFKPIRAGITDPNRIPVFLLQSHFHGQEISSGAAVYQFLVDLYDNTDREDDRFGVLSFLKNNIEFRVIPIINPYGFNNQERKNIRGIDTNTNFETDFVVEDPEYVYYGGEEPMTEQETLTMDRWYREFSDAIGMIDMHNMAGTHQGGWGGCWNISPSPETRLLARNVSDTVGRHWRTNGSGFENAPPTANLGWADERIAGLARRQAYKKYGIESITLDTLRVVNFKEGAVNFDKYSVQLAADFLGATIVSMVKNFGIKG